MRLIKLFENIANSKNTFSTYPFKRRLNLKQILINAKYKPISSSFNFSSFMSGTSQIIVACSLETFSKVPKKEKPYQTLILRLVDWARSIKGNKLLFFEYSFFKLKILYGKKNDIMNKTNEQEQKLKTHECSK